MVYFSGVHSMSEVTGQLEQGTPADAEAGRQPSAGEMLRQARESAGLSIATLAVALKVSVKRLEALEADRLDLLPDAVFVRALASSVCRALKIDPAPVLNRLPQTAVPRLDVDGGGLKTPFQTPGDVTHVSAWSQLSRPVVLAALTLLVGALVLIFFPSMDSMLVSVATAPETATPAPTAASTEDAAPVVENAGPLEVTPAPRKSAAPETPVKPPVAPVKPAVQPAPAQIVASSSSGSSVVTPVQGRTTQTGVIVFKTQGPSWIEVTDGLGGVQIRRTINVGEVVGVSGPLPLSVVVGRADITEVEVRGKPFTLQGFTRENVARFEVK
jgi:cytoskeleton protein RodZ